MAIDQIGSIGRVGGIEELSSNKGAKESLGQVFSETLTDAVQSVDRLQKDSETAQVAYARGAEVDLHDVLIKIEEAEVAFMAMMEVRSKLVDAYREVMRIGSGG